MTVLLVVSHLGRGFACEQNVCVDGIRMDIPIGQWMPGASGRRKTCLWADAEAAYLMPYSLPFLLLYVSSPYDEPGNG